MLERFAVGAIVLRARRRSVPCGEGMLSSSSYWEKECLSPGRGCVFTRESGRIFMGESGYGELDWLTSWERGILT